jgi:hypothetical protein
MGILNFCEFCCVIQPKRKLAAVGYTSESGLLGVAYAGESGLARLPGVAYTDEYRSSVWPTQRTPHKKISQKITSVGYTGESGLLGVGYTGESLVQPSRPGNALKGIVP